MQAASSPERWPMSVRRLELATGTERPADETFDSGEYVLPDQAQRESNRQPAHQPSRISRKAPW